MTDFTHYSHSQPIIFSHLNKMYSSTLLEHDTFSILFTSVGFHYVTGTPPKTTEVFKSVLRQYIQETNTKELVLFEDDPLWQSFLNTVFQEINGVIDQRVSYTLDKEAFHDIYKDYTFHHNVTLTKEQPENATRPYPVAEIKHNNKVISYCKGFLIGQNMVECDVFTQEDYRHKHMALECSLSLIDYVLTQSLTPTWSAWKVKTASHELALKCGFKDPKDINAYVWVSDFGKF